ncbi:uncharacterized protein L3040_002709 [Drepanopeziza brunnea f. sp. 'multigermtubi']|uniref:uncharacterized protein n=1 Tax=Drepanopeziza brunnea f. sp. 'multigermtubi' TaxID=698441 RepID=UPI00238A3B7E|nr:hypothetical protein L3040_002709 [Drepanopeziza brunnea f. sp. 'multigermtubi']
MASSQRRRSSVNRESVSSILAAGEPSKPADPPSPHIGTSPNRAHFAEPPSLSAGRHARAMSYTPRRPNRLSLSFPVAPSLSESARPTPTSSEAPTFPSTPVEKIAPPNPDEHGKFLVALAGQERKVFELKEELSKAEEELRILKKQYAKYEAAKKRAELRHVEPLQSVITDGGNSGDPSAVPRQSAELDRRRALLNNLNLPKDSRRKFSGAHTRALSLLSPERSNFHQPQPFPPVPESSAERTGFPRTIPDISQGIKKTSSNRVKARHSYQIGVPLGAKQLAEDLKSGLWTFMEDLRQATVGDEAVNGTTSRSTLDLAHGAPVKTSSKNSLKGNDRGKSPRSMSPRTWETLTGSSPLLAGLSDEPEAQALPRANSPSTVKKSRPLSLAAPPLGDLDDWGNWDSPIPKSPRWSGSSTVSNPATPSNGNNADENVQIIGQNADGVSTPTIRTDIQWPALDNLSPGALKGNLQRTMSTIMKEWEKSIQMPVPAEERAAGVPTGSDAPPAASTTEDVAMMSR